MILIILLLLLAYYLSTSTITEDYCRECGCRIQMAQVYAHPDHVSGMGWVL